LNMENILILHGWGSQAEKWSEIKEFLESGGYRVYVPDLPGFGESPLPSKPWSVDDYAEWVRSFCEKKNLSQFFLLGHSFGGSIAIKFSLRYYEKVKKLILVDSAGIRRKSRKKEISRKIANFLSRFSFLPFYSLIRKIFYRTIFRSDYLLTKGVMRDTYLRVIKEDLSGVLSSLTVPTLLIWGEKDKITPLKDAYLMKEKIPGAKLEVLANVKHSPRKENPQALVEKILKFL